jgi:hypothetical protein
MPCWVIVAESDTGVPMVLADWVMGQRWVRADVARRREVDFAIFRDRWRAKRQWRRVERRYAPRVLELDRL